MKSDGPLGMLQGLAPWLRRGPLNPAGDGFSGVHSPTTWHPGPSTFPHSVTVSGVGYGRVCSFPGQVSGVFRGTQCVCVKGILSPAQTLGRGMAQEEGPHSSVGVGHRILVTKWKTGGNGSVFTHPYFTIFLKKFIFIV